MNERYVYIQCVLSLSLKLAHAECCVLTQVRATPMVIAIVDSSSIQLSADFGPMPQAHNHRTHIFHLYV